MYTWSHGVQYKEHEIQSSVKIQKEMLTHFHWC